MLPQKPSLVEQKRLERIKRIKRQMKWLRGLGISLDKFNINDESLELHSTNFAECNFNLLIEFAKALENSGIELARQIKYIKDINTKSENTKISDITKQLKIESLAYTVDLNRHELKGKIKISKPKTKSNDISQLYQTVSRVGQGSVKFNFEVMTGDFNEQGNGTSLEGETLFKKALEDKTNFTVEDVKLLNENFTDSDIANYHELMMLCYPSEKNLFKAGKVDKRTSNFYKNELGQLCYDLVLNDPQIAVFNLQNMINPPDQKEIKGTITAKFILDSDKGFRLSDLKTSNSALAMLFTPGNKVKLADIMGTLEALAASEEKEREKVQLRTHDLIQEDFNELKAKVQKITWTYKAKCHEHITDIRLNTSFPHKKLTTAQNIEYNKVVKLSKKAFNELPSQTNGSLLYATLNKVNQAIEQLDRLYYKKVEADHKRIKRSFIDILLRRKEKEPVFDSQSRYELYSHVSRELLVFRGELQSNLYLDSFAKDRPDKMENFMSPEGHAFSNDSIQNYKAAPHRNNLSKPIMGKVRQELTFLEVKEKIYGKIAVPTFATTQEKLNGIVAQVLHNRQWWYSKALKREYTKMAYDACSIVLLDSLQRGEHSFQEVFGDPQNSSSTSLTSRIKEQLGFNKYCKPTDDKTMAPIIKDIKAKYSSSQASKVIVVENDSTNKKEIASAPPVKSVQDTEPMSSQQSTLTEHRGALRAI